MFIKYYDRIVNALDIERMWIDHYEEDPNEKDSCEMYSIMVETFSGDRFFMADEQGHAIGLMLYYMQQIFDALRDNRDLDMDELRSRPIPSERQMRHEGIPEGIISMVLSYKEECEREAEDFSFGKE